EGKHRSRLRRGRETHRGHFPDQGGVKRHFPSENARFHSEKPRFGLKMAVFPLKMAVFPLEKPCSRARMPYFGGVFGGWLSTSHQPCRGPNGCEEKEGCKE